MAVFSSPCSKAQPRNVNAHHQTAFINGIKVNLSILETVLLHFEDTHLCYVGTLVYFTFNMVQIGKFSDRIMGHCRFGKTCHGALLKIIQATFGKAGVESDLGELIRSEPMNEHLMLIGGAAASPVPVLESFQWTERGAFNKVFLFKLKLRSESKSCLQLQYQPQQQEQ
ncbi:hypothetical protein HDU76_001511 [Blyttiomyces sp. JEL0837]|nr:hypothetical protein HDU76_001511 [Blyttiomyces sp. JEL0837]